MSPYGPMVAYHLNELEVPESLKRQIDYGPPGSWPPQAGCGACPDLALGRMWARIDLAQWIHESPGSFGPHRDGELDSLCTVGARLRCAGEGTQVVWGIDVLSPEQWVTHDSTGLAVAELVCIGPHLPDCLVNKVDTALATIGWKYPSEVEPNSPCIVNHTRCFHTSWHDGITASANPAAKSRLEWSEHE